MDLYTVAKYLHIALAVAWLGGNFSLFVLATVAARRDDGDAISTIVIYSEVLAKFVFVPSVVLILALGVYMVWAQWGFSEAWIIVGIAGVVMTFAIGAGILSPMINKLAGMAPGPDKQALQVRLLRSVRADLIMMFVILWAMVSKPAWSDGTELLIILAIVVLGAALFLRR